LSLSLPTARSEKPEAKTMILETMIEREDNYGFKIISNYIWTHFFS
jgi:hypothetical protein